MKTTELYQKLSAEIPSALSCDWDNDGIMLLPSENHTVKKILLTLDVTAHTIALAKKQHCNLIISHHPFLFRPLSRFSCEDAKVRDILTLLEADIAVFSFHTRLDAATDGVNDALAQLLQLNNIVPLICDEIPLGRIGTLTEQISFEKFLALVSKKLKAPQLSYIQETDFVRTVAVVGGDGKDYISAAKAAGADLYLTGQASYNSMLDAKGGGMSVIEAGHYYTEAPVLHLLQKRLHRLGVAEEMLIDDTDCEIFNIHA